MTQMRAPSSSSWEMSHVARTEDFKGETDRREEGDEQLLAARTDDSKVRKVMCLKKGRVYGVGRTS